MFAFKNAETRINTGFQTRESRGCDTLYLSAEKQGPIGLQLFKTTSNEGGSMDSSKLNIFSMVKQSVTPWQAASFYGLKPDNHGMCRCLFHDDRTPSMKLYDDHFYCFGCEASGDVIDLTGKLLDLSPKETVARLCHDFGIYPDADGHDAYRPRDQPVPIPNPATHSSNLKRPVTAARTLLKEKVNAATYTLLGIIRITQELMRKYAPADPMSEWNAVFSYAAEHHARAEILLDILLFSDRDELETFFIEHDTELKIYEHFVREDDERKDLLYARKLQHRN